MIVLSSIHVGKKKALSSCMLTMFLHVFSQQGLLRMIKQLLEPRSEKTGLQGFRPGLTQTGLYSHRRW